MILCFTWGNPDPLNVGVIIVYLVIAFLMIRTIQLGREQLEVSLNQLELSTKQIAQSLAISQFNILQK